MEERVNSLLTMTRLDPCSRNKPFETVMGKRENAGDQHSLTSFPHNVFYPIQREIAPFDTL